MGRIQTGRKLLAAAPETSELLRQLLIQLKHSWKIRALSKALTHALADSREASSWPGERLPVGFQMSEEVELITQRIQLETEAWAAHVIRAARTT